MYHIISFLTRNPIISSFNLTDEEVLDEILKDNENFLSVHFTQSGLEHFIFYFKKCLPFKIIKEEMIREKVSGYIARNSGYYPTNSNEFIYKYTCKIIGV